MNANRSRFVLLAMRELLLLGIVALAAAVFLNHGILYLNGTALPRSNRPEAYVLVTAVFYALVRGTDMILRMRPARVAGDLVLCPECGQELGDGTPKGTAGHARIPFTPKPTEREVLAAVALRKALDDARRIAAHRGRADPIVSGLQGDPENPPTDEREIPEGNGGPASLPKIPREPWRPRLGR